MHTFTIVFWTAVFLCTWPHRAVLIAHGWTQTHRGVTLRQAVVTQTTHAFTHTPPVAMGVYGSIWENAGAGNFKENGRPKEGFFTRRLPQLSFTRSPPRSLFHRFKLHILDTPGFYSLPLLQGWMGIHRVCPFAGVDQG